MQRGCCQTDSSSDCTKVCAFIRVCRNSVWKSCCGRGCWIRPIGNQWEETQGWPQSGIGSLQITSGNKYGKEAAGISCGRQEDTIKFSGTGEWQRTWITKNLGPFVTVGSKIVGEDMKARGHFRTYSLQSCLQLLMVMNILVLCSSFLLFVKYDLYSLPSLHLDWLSPWENLFVGMCDFLKINLFPFSFPHLFLVKMYEF